MQARVIAWNPLVEEDEGSYQPKWYAVGFLKYQNNRYDS